MVNLVKWEMSILAVQVVVSVALSIVALTLLVEMTFLIGVLFTYFWKML